jgi:acylaminoacyl-peptidase
MNRILLAFLGLSIVATARPASGQQTKFFQALDVFELEVASDPRVSPDGHSVVYVRRGFDVSKDATRTALWLAAVDGTVHRPLTDGTSPVSEPRWSPDGSRLAYVAKREERSRIFVRWMDTGDTVEIADLEHAPSGLAWSPDGSRIAFSMFVPDPSPIVSPVMPAAPDGADWGADWTVIDEMVYRRDGSGYAKEGLRHYFRVPADGGTAARVTSDDCDHAGAPSWTPDGRSLVYSANCHERRDEDPQNSEIHRVDVSTGTVEVLTDRFGPDTSPAVSADGRIAFTGFDDRFQGHQSVRLYVMNADGGDRRALLPDLDRSVSAPRWSLDGRRVYFQYDDLGQTRIAFTSTDDRLSDLGVAAGGLSIGRPYTEAQYDVSPDGTVAYTTGRPDRPADLAVARDGREPVQLTTLNEDLLGNRTLGEVEEIWYESSFDDRRIQGWIVRPPDFDPGRRYPLILEIHGGPFAAYGPHFAAEMQLYAAAGYVVLYTNPRGSTSYGEEFGNLIHHAYPGNDYDDLMSGVDAVVRLGYVDPEQLFVTGGSGGGVLSAWIVGRTDRFRAAVVQKPVINWFSFVLYSDSPAFFHRYWFPGPPWDHVEHYMARSPISLAGNVTTPTMLITGEQDHRTPMAESEQYYAALKIRGVEAALVRVPDASHDIAALPSNLVAKAAHVLAWFDRYRSPETDGSPRRTQGQPRGW